MSLPSPEQLKTLKRIAKSAALNAYSPHSDFSVGSALISKAGNIYSGCNVENQSFGATQCAERNAINTGITQEGPTFKIAFIIVIESNGKELSPCGICRQVIAEFSDKDTQIGYGNPEYLTWRSIKDLLPDGFELNK